MRNADISELIVKANDLNEILRECCIKRTNEIVKEFNDIAYDYNFPKMICADMFITNASNRFLEIFVRRHNLNWGSLTNEFIDAEISSIVLEDIRKVFIYNIVEQASLKLVESDNGDIVVPVKDIIEAIDKIGIDANNNYEKILNRFFSDSA